MRQGTTDQSKALQKVTKLEAQLEAQGLQQVTILSGPSGATLMIDGLESGITPSTTELVLGSHVAVLSLRGYEAAQRSFELRPDRSMDVEVALALATPEAKPAHTEEPMELGIIVSSATGGTYEPAMLTIDDVAFVRQRARTASDLHRVQSLSNR